MKQYDVIIIGGGVTGTAIARELSRYRLNIALLEKEEELAFGVSKANSGIIHPGTQNPPGSLKGRLCVRGNRLIRKISGELGIDFKEVGALIVALDRSDIPRLEQLRKEGEALGVPGLRIVKSSWLKKNEPNLTRDAVAALYAPTCGIISPYRFVYDLAENAAANGVEIFTLTKVTGVSAPVGNRSKKDTFEIATSRGTFTARSVVNAAGLFADEISKMAGITDFKIKPRKGQEFLLDKKRQYLTNHVIFPLPTEKSKGMLVIKTADGNPMIGPTAEDIDDKTDLSTTDEGLEGVLTSVRKLVPSISGGDIIAYFAGLRPVAGHDFIIRHEDKAPGLINVAGIQSPGLTAAPAIALMVKDLLESNGLDLKKKKVFHKHRKKEIHLFNIPLAETQKIIRKNAGYGDIVCRCEMVSAEEVREAIRRGATTLDGIKFRTRAQAGRCHGGFCTTRLMKILAEETKRPVTEVTKRGKGSEIVAEERK